MEQINKPSAWLLEHGRNVYSQVGEDGIIEKILELIPKKDKWCVEFGAWDGLHLSNTRNLIEYHGYSAVLIEADKNKFRDLQKNYFDKNNVTTINKFVGFTEKDNLDNILRSIPIPLNFDLISIDIDGNDYYVWKSFVKYMPKVVIIEFNNTIPPHVRFVQPADPSINQGTSLLSLVDLAKEKGYELVSVLSVNAFFVKKEYYHSFQIESNSPEVLQRDLDNVTYLFSGYDGTIFLHGGCKLPWHDIKLNESDFQLLPAFLRAFPGNYTTMQRVLFGLYLIFIEPPRLLRAILKRLKNVLPKK